MRKESRSQSHCCQTWNVLDHLRERNELVRCMKMLGLRLASKRCWKKLMSEKNLRNNFMTQATCWIDKFLEQSFSNSDSITELWCVFINFVCFFRDFFQCHLKLTLIVACHFFNFQRKFSCDTCTKVCEMFRITGSCVVYVH